MDALDLDEGDRYTIAALFTLATYCTAVEGGMHLHGIGADAGVWGLPFEVLAESYSSDRASPASSGWGWPLVGPQGVCGKVFGALSIRPTSAVCLLSLPDGLHPLATDKQKDMLWQLVLSFAQQLDGQLQFVTEAPGSALSLLTANAAAPEASDGKEPPTASQPLSRGFSDVPRAPESEASEAPDAMCDQY
jgi:hypothetical protein